MGEPLESLRCCQALVERAVAGVELRFEVARVRQGRAVGAVACLMGGKLGPCALVSHFDVLIALADSPFPAGIIKRAEIVHIPRIHALPRQAVLPAYAAAELDLDEVVHVSKGWPAKP